MTTGFLAKVTVLLSDMTRPKKCRGAKKSKGEGEKNARQVLNLREVCLLPFAFRLVYIASCPTLSGLFTLFVIKSGSLPQLTHIVIPKWFIPPHLAPNKQKRENMKYISSLVPRK